MGETRGYTGASGLMKLAFIFMMAAVILQLFAMTSGLTQATTGVTVTMILAFLSLFIAGILTLLLYYLPETENHRTVTMVTVVLGYLAALLIAIGLIVHAAEIKAGPPAYSTTLIVVCGALAICSCTCMLLELTGKFTLSPVRRDQTEQPRDAPNNI